MASKQCSFMKRLIFSNDALCVSQSLSGSSPSARAVDHEPQAVDRLRLGKVGEDGRRPLGHGDADDAPDVQAELHAPPVGLALRVDCMGAHGGLHGVDALELHGVLALEAQERRALLGERVELDALPFGNVLEELEVVVLEGEARDLVVVPDHGHGAGARLVGGAHDAAHEIGALDGTGHDQLLPGLDGAALAHDQGCIAVELRGEGLGCDAALLVGHGNGHGGPSIGAGHPAVLCVSEEKAPRGGREFLERATGFEPANTSLGSWGLTTWRCPHSMRF